MTPPSTPADQPAADRELPHVALSQHAHDRQGILRTDDAWLERAWQAEDTLVLVLSGARLRPVGGRIDWQPPADVPDGVRLLLGERDGSARFAVMVDADDAPGDATQWLPLRLVLQALADDGGTEAPLVFHAIGLAEWHLATRHCPRCGGALASQQAGHVLACAACGRQQFPRTDPAVIMLVREGEPGSAEERCLLGRGAGWPEGRFSTLAGFVEPGETLEDAVRREVAEETGVRIGEVTYFGSQPWPLPASLMLGFVAEATSTQVDVDGSEVLDARWFTREQMRAETEAGTLVLPGGVSISRSLIEDWYGGRLPGHW
ncbi:NAD(+) diphosphatase [Nocardioides pacificus]